MDPCCPSKPGPSEPKFTEEDMLNDPTMSSCCLRDIQNQRKGAELRAKLLSVDPTAVRNKLQQHVLLHEAPEQQEDASDDGLGSDDDGKGTMHLAFPTTWASM